jgi:hypothetical protein
VLAAISDQYSPANWHAFYKRQGVALINSAAILFEASALSAPFKHPNADELVGPAALGEYFPTLTAVATAPRSCQLRVA